MASNGLREGTKYGERLLVHVIDDVAERDPGRCFCIVPRSQPGHGFQKVTYAQFANAINTVAWWIEQECGKGIDYETIAYVGPNDLRYIILTFAAQKTFHKVRVRDLAPKSI